MKIYIPFNSNDYNNVLSTLSISPRSFYEVRDYGFKRASRTILNPLEDALVGYDKPVFHKEAKDVDNGYPVIIALNYDIKLNNGEPSNYALIYKTVYLFSDFEILFRKTSEKKEIEARSLRSVETKFIEIAKGNSRVIDNDEAKWVDNPPKDIDFDEYQSQNFKREDFEIERQINKIIGALTGFAIGSQRNLPIVFRNLYQYSHDLNNHISLLINRIGQVNELNTKKQLIKILDDIKKEFEHIQPIESSIKKHLNGENTENILSILRNIYYETIPLYDLLLDGLQSSKIENIPLQLKTENVKRALNFRVNKNYPNRYIERVTDEIQGLQTDIENLISINISTALDPNVLSADISPTEIYFNACDGYNHDEKIYLQAILKYLIEEDTFATIDDLHSDRQRYLGVLGVHIRDSIEDFESSDVAKYLRSLLKSFKDLTSSFDVDQTHLDSIKSVTILFTKGRDFLQYRDAVETSSIKKKEISYAIWGAAFGYAGLPKTMTSHLFEKESNKGTVLKAMDSIIKELYSKHGYSNIQYEPDTYSKQDSESNTKSKALLYKNINEDTQTNIDYKRLERLIEKVKKIPRIRKDQELINLIQHSFNEVEENSKLVLFNSKESKYEQFRDKIKCNRIKGVGEGTLKKIAEAYRDCI